MRSLLSLALLFVVSGTAQAKFRIVTGTCVSTDQVAVKGTPPKKYQSVAKWCGFEGHEYDYHKLCAKWSCPSIEVKRDGDLECKVKRFELVEKSAADKVLPKGKAAILIRKIENSHAQDHSNRDCRALLEADTKAYADLDKESEESPRNFDADSCEWVDLLPRKIVKGPDGCGKSKDAEICTGYVKCKRVTASNDAPFFVRQSTCSPEKCADAVACTKETGFGSSAPGDEEKVFLNKTIKDKVLKGKAQ